jgi:hypothetical protein
VGSSEETIILEKEWISQCNEKSYTQVLADRMGFKNSLNFGIQGASNDRSMTHLESFLRNNPTMKIFVLFNFTNSIRYMQFFKVHGKKEYDSIDMTPSMNFLDDKYHRYFPIIDKASGIKQNMYTGIDSKSVVYNYTYWRNSVQDVYNHVKIRRTIYYILSSYNVPHATFDIMNDTDSRMIHDNPLKYISKENSDGCFGNFLVYDDDESYVFKEMDFLNSYYQELVDKSPLLTHLRMDYMPGCVDMCNYIWKMGEDKYDDKNHYISEHGMHWNIEGHIEAAKLIEKFINERYN